LLLIVWTGFDDNTNLPLTGSQAALPIWVEFMKRATALRRYRDTMPFKAPSGMVTVEVDADTGMLATPLCPNRKAELFIEGGSPVEPCSRHSPGGGARVNLRVFCRNLFWIASCTATTSAHSCSGRGRDGGSGARYAFSGYWYGCGPATDVQQTEKKKRGSSRDCSWRGRREGQEGQ